MKVLLDAQLPTALRDHFIGHQVATVGYLDLKHLQNGELIAAAAERGFEVIVTADRGYASEQNLAKLPTAVLLLQYGTTEYEPLIEAMPEILASLNIIKRRTLLRVPAERRKLR